MIELFLSVVAPVFNEEDGIHEFLTRTVKSLNGEIRNFEILIIDDGSKDATFEKIKEFIGKDRRVRAIKLSRNYGREIALTAGLDNSIGDYVVLIDADLQDPPELIPKLIEKANEGFDVVYAARKERLGESWLRRFSSRMFYSCASWLTRLPIPQNAGDYRLLSRKVVNSLISLKEHNRYMKMLYAYVGFRETSIEFVREPRYSGKSKYKYSNLLLAALDAIISFSNQPLRIMGIFSFFLSALLFLMACVVILQRILMDNLVEGWASLMVIMLGMFSCLFLFLTVLSEYVGRILTETKNRPLYYVSEDIGGEDLAINPIIIDI